MSVSVPYINRLCTHTRTCKDGLTHCVHEHIGRHYIMCIHSCTMYRNSVYIGRISMQISHVGIHYTEHYSRCTDYIMPQFRVLAV